MASASSSIKAMNDIMLEDEEEGGIVVGSFAEIEENDIFNRLDVKLCLVVNRWNV